jgi:general secretion pathway protein K
MRSQRGVAAVTAVLIVAVAAAAAALMLAQQSATLDQAMLVAARAQADLYAHAGLDWSRGVLAQDARSSSVDSLDEGWAQPIAALPVERALVSGSIADEQGKFNLNNLVAAGQKSEPDVVVFRGLLGALGLAPDLADAVLDWIDADSDLASGSGAEDPYYLSLPRPYRAANAPMVQVEELYRVRGFDAATVAKLKPFVTALPADARTAINVNTASAPVLAAALPKASPELIAKLVARRASKPFASATELATLIGADAAASNVAIDVKSSFFAVRIQVSQDDVQLASEALVRRVAATSGGTSPTSIVWRRSRY